MFGEITLAEFRKNGLEPEEPYSDTEMSFSVEEGSIIYKSRNHTFLVSDYTFWAPATFAQFSALGAKIKASLIHETDPFAISFNSSESGFSYFDFDFVNVAIERKGNLFNIFNEVRSLYEFESGYIKQSKNTNAKPWYRSSYLKGDNLRVDFNPDTISLSLCKVTESGAIPIIDLKQSGDVLRELFSEITEYISIQLASDGVRAITEIHPYGFRLDVSNNKEDLVLDFEFFKVDDTQIHITAIEFLKKENYRTTSTPFFEEWYDNVYINFENGKISFLDNGLLNTIKRRQLTSHFSYK